MAAGRFICTSPVLVGLAGAPCLATVDEAEIAVGHALTLNIGHELRLSPPTLGARIYLSLPGGVHCQALRRGGVLME